MKQNLINALKSVKLTLACLGLSMVLVVIGTLAQVKMGTFAAQKEFFNSWLLYASLGDWKIPVFPGGLSVGLLWIVNLVAAFVDSFQYRRRDVGILVSHAGIILLMAGQFLTQTLAHESNIPIEIGQSRHYSERFRDMELALIMTSDPTTDQITSIPESFFNHPGRIDPPGIPVSLVIKNFYANAKLEMKPSSGLRRLLPQQGEGSAGLPLPAEGEGRGEGLATQGVGTQIGVQELPAESSDDATNTAAAFIEVLDGEKSLGTWLVSSGLGAPQSFNVQGKDYQLLLRPRRHYFPFTLTLKEFHHDTYLGTDIPKNFSSVVHIENPAKKESRDALIYMNHPFRYDGKTFYQASFGKGDRMSVFQVVENPASWAPYISCSLVILGLAIQFMSHLIGFVRQRS